MNPPASRRLFPAFPARAETLQRDHSLAQRPAPLSCARPCQPTSAPFLPIDPGHLWLTCEAAGQTAGFCYAVPEPLTDGTWNTRAIAVHPDHQSSGRDSALIAAVEANLRAAGQHLLVVDTSGTSAYAATRTFYLRNGYETESRIRDCWGPGDDKITFRKAL
jgi:GNAT superfamily N-acetyltransferase